MQNATIIRKYTNVKLLLTYTHFNDQGCDFILKNNIQNIKKIARWHQWLRRLQIKTQRNIRLSLNECFGTSLPIIQPTRYNGLQECVDMRIIYFRQTPIVNCACVKRIMPGEWWRHQDKATTSECCVTNSCKKWRGLYTFLSKILIQLKKKNFFF